MLGTLRENKNSTIISFIVGLIVLAFIMWGPGVSRKQKGTYIARVNNKTVTQSQFGRAVRNRMEQMRRYSNQELSKADTDLIQQQVLDQLLERELLRQEADRLGVVVSDEELKKTIVESFKDGDGKFDERAWRRVKRWNPNFEQDQRDDMQIAKLRDFVRAAITVSDADLLDTYQEQNTKVNIEYVKLPYYRFERDVEVTPEERESYLKEHENEVQAQYDSDFERIYNIPRKVKASHILLKYEEGDSSEFREQLMEKMKLIRERAGSEDFAELARQYSEDEDTAARGGSLGFFDEKRKDPAFTNAAFSTPVGQISEIVVSEAGVHVIKVEDAQEASVKSLEEVRDSIVDKILKKEKGPLLARQAAEKISTEWSKQGPELEKLLEEYKLSIQETGLSSRSGDNLRGVGRSLELVDAAFGLLVGEPPPATVFTVGDAEVLVRLKERQEADMSKFEEEKGRLASGALYRKQQQVFSAWVDTLKSGADIDVNDRLGFDAS